MFTTDDSGVVAQVVIEGMTSSRADLAVSLLSLTEETMDVVGEIVLERVSSPI